MVDNPEPAGPKPPDWIDIPADMARDHPLYGIRGWALFLVIVNILTGLSGLAYAYRDTPAWSELEGVAALFALPFFILGYGFPVLFLISAVLLACKKRSFRKFFLGTLMAGPALFILVSCLGYLALMAKGAPNAFREAFDLIEILRSILALAVWGGYVVVSKRINVTILHRVAPDDPFLRRVARSPRAAAPAAVQGGAAVSRRPAPGNG